MHALPLEEQAVPLIPYPEWAAHEPEIARVFTDFMRNVDRHPREVAT